VYQQAPAIAAGVSQVKCTTLYNPRQLAGAVAAKTLPRAALDGLARPLLSVLFQYNLIGAPHPATPAAPVAVVAHESVALQTANEGAVLLKNTADLLPLNFGRLSSLALIGPDGATPMPAGFGAVYVRPVTHDSALEALRGALGPRLHYNNGNNIASAVATAAHSAVVVIVAFDVEVEGKDRTSLELPGDQNALIAAVERANPRTVVVLETGAAVLMPWLRSTPALLETWYPGEAAGTSLLQLLSGQVDPSGKLPVTFPVSAAASPAKAPVAFGGVGGRTEYSDGINVGYRWYDAHHVTPAFSFGFGLSYTNFAFSGLQVTSAPSGGVAVSVKVSNIGFRAGADIVQCYVGDPASTGEAPRQLRGFQRVSLRAGATTNVTMHLVRGDLATWDSAAQTWKVTAGNYQIWVGDGSDVANLPLHATVAELSRTLGPNSGPVPAPAN
jgi:beta-glucosidase